MIYYKGDALSPKKNDKGWYISYPSFIIIGKEYAYEETLDYEGFLIKEITDKKGKKVPIIGLKLHTCEVKCGESCEICGKYFPHKMNIIRVEKHPYYINTHIEHLKCSICGHEETKNSSHEINSTLLNGVVEETCTMCGFKQRLKIEGLGLIYLTQKPSKEVFFKNFENLINEVKEISRLLREYNELKDGKLTIPSIVKFLRGGKMYYERGWERDTNRYLFHKKGKVFEEITLNTVSESLSPDEMGYRESYRESSQRVQDFGHSVEWVLKKVLGADWRKELQEKFKEENEVKRRLARLEELKAILPSIKEKINNMKNFRFVYDNKGFDLYQTPQNGVYNHEVYEKFLEYVNGL